MKKQFRSLFTFLAIFAMITFTTSIMTSCDSADKDATEESVDDADATADVEDTEAEMKCSSGKCGGEGKCGGDSDAEPTDDAATTDDGTVVEDENLEEGE